ncbi:Putative 40S ribosomal protein S17-A [Rhizopus microsporus]|nr:Putative 40S ribosomal protein S17-A [Rhizopus microsporus]
MGRVRTKTVKKASRVIIEKYYPRLTLSAIEIDPETESLLKAINFENLPGVKVTTPVAPVAPRRNTRPRKTEA